ncbi:N-acetyltransferase family protein [Edaphovirga cremea]|uniref:GNAT family N-acetyltransferase n=1 Tax=Edaphovirga cremea TaxID=2267246 RepID=UPI003988C25C
MTTLELLFNETPDADLQDLSQVLHACVQDDASIGFITPFSLQEAEAFWRRLLPQFAAGERFLLVARQQEKIVGTVQLVVSMPDNGQHRAEVAKLMVHPQFRRQGIAEKLMHQIELLARSQEKTLLVLDTRSDDSAEPLYQKLGYELSGRIPQYARSTRGAMDSTSVMYKLLK